MFGTSIFSRFESRSYLMFAVLIALIVVVAILGGCTAQEQATAVQYGDSACHAATELEAVDPALAAHNGKVVVGQTAVCTVVSKIAVPVVSVAAPAAPAAAAAAPAPAPVQVLVN